MAFGLRLVYFSDKTKGQLLLKIFYNYRYRADHETGYTAEVTYEGEARPYVAPPKPAYPAARI